MKLTVTFSSLNSWFTLSIFTLKLCSPIYFHIHPSYSTLGCCSRTIYIEAALHLPPAVITSQLVQSKSEILKNVNGNRQLSFLLGMEGVSQEHSISKDGCHKTRAMVFPTSPWQAFFRLEKYHWR